VVGSCWGFRWFYGCWCVLSGVVANSGGAVILFVGCLFDGFSRGDSSEINCCSQRAAISSLHSLIRQRNFVKHSLKSDIVGLVYRRN
jgi:hypothetical protein